MFPYLPQGLECVDRVAPELHRRGIFPTEYERRTVRKNLGSRGRATGSSEAALLRHRKGAISYIAALQLHARSCR